MRRLVCPYCFERFPSHDLAFRCNNPDPRRCQTEEDLALAEYQRKVTADKMPRVFTPEKQWLRAPTSAVCKCGIKTSKLVCPICHNELPSQFGQIGNRIIALIGSKEAGKSNYIAVLIHELMNRVGKDFKAALMPLDDRTITRYRNDFERYIYDKREVIPGTLSARAQIDVRYPLIYKFSRQTPGKFLSNGKQITSLIFFDTAGEDLNSQDLMATETKYLANSDGIIFLLDPLQIPDVRDHLENPGHLPSIETHPRDIISRVVNLIRQSHNMKPKDRIRTPIALAFSKFDEIRRLIHPASPLHKASNHRGYFDELDGEQVSDSMRRHVVEWIGDGLDSLVEDNFDNFAYFGLSALGSAPENGSLSKGVVPLRVEDPLLWILHKLKVIPGKRS
jgi:hypothetical protein